MRGYFTKKIGHLISCTLFLTVVLALLYFLRYIDISVIMSIYLPIWVIGVVATLIGKVIFADVIITLAGVGIFAEYLVHIFNKPYSNMSGAFLNTFILITGFIVGIVLQILNTRKKSDISNR